MIFMNVKRPEIWVGVAIAEAFLILVFIGVALLWNFRVSIRATSRSAPVAATINPLRLALDYDLPDEKFREIVQQYPNWINYRTQFDGGFNSSILADCAMLRRTNYVRVLIQNGANIEEAIRENLPLDKGSVELIRQVEHEVNSTRAVPR